MAKVCQWLQSQLLLLLLWWRESFWKKKYSQWKERLFSFSDDFDDDFENNDNAIVANVVALGVPVLIFVSI